VVAWGRLALVGGWRPRGNAPLHRCSTSAGGGLTRLLLLLLLLRGCAVTAGRMSFEKSLELSGEVREGADLARVYHPDEGLPDSILEILAQHLDDELLTRLAPLDFPDR
jgi:hypothetical protein